MGENLHRAVWRPPLLAPATISGLRLSNAGLMQTVFLFALLPVAIFALCLKPVAAGCLLAGVALAAAIALRGWEPGERLSAPIDPALYAGCLATGLALCLIGGEYHLFFANSDWYTRDAVLADLVDNKYPVFYRFQGADFILRAPLGMYLAPAAVGWIFGLDAAHLALLLQNAFLFAGIFYFLAMLENASKPRFLLIFLLSGPIDLIPHVICDYLFPEGGQFLIRPHFMFWNPLASFWAQTPQLFWAPNHAFSGWMMGTLLLLHARRETDVALLATSSIVLLFWSPLAMIGSAPLLVMAGAQSLSPALLSRRTALAALAGALLLPLLVYLTLDASALSRGWLFDKRGFFVWYPLALLFGLPQMWLLLLSRDVVPEWLKPTFFAACATLVLVPLYRMGANAADNDVAMRGMLTPMFLLGFVFSAAAPRLVEGPQPRAGLALAIIAMSASTGLMEIRRGLADPAYAINDCNLVTVSEKMAPGSPVGNYLAHVDKAPAWLVSTRGRRLEIERRECWPGYALADKTDGRR